jgi:hypothetical protein
MALINRTYFTGELFIPNGNVDGGPVAEELEGYIQKYETQFLRYALGHELYTALKAGLLSAPLAQRWADLISGTDYVDQGNRGYTWKGLVPSIDLSVSISAFEPLFVEVGRGRQYDPAAGTVTTIPASLVGQRFTIEQRGFGPLDPETDYTMVGNQLTLTNSVFSAGNKYVYRTGVFDFSTAPGTVKESPIAMYVYYWYIRNLFTQTSPMGEVGTANENAAPANPGYKMTRAWNEMATWIREMAFFLNTKRDVYPEWNSQFWGSMMNYFRPINEFNI